MENICPNYEKCPIYSGILKGSEMTSKAYVSMYCKAGELEYEKCKRYQIKELTGVCPPDLLPNSIMSLEEIKRKYID